MARKHKAEYAQGIPMRADVATVKAQYDAVAPGAKTKRRKATLETTGETGSDSRQLPPMARLLMINLCRDAARNFSSCRSMLRQLALNVVGTEYKLRIKIPHDRKNPNDPVTIAENWFNKGWARKCDFRGDLHLSDINRLLVQTVARDGDAGQLFDRDFLGTGRLISYDSDQICDPTPLPAGVASSKDGVLLDAYGREIGYFTTAKCGQVSAPVGEGHVHPRDPEDEDANMFRLFRTPWRFNQGRGTSDLFSVVADMLDIYEMRAKELQSAKVAASMGGIVVKRIPEGAPLNDPRLDPANTNPEATDKPTEEETKYERLEALTGGYMEYLEKDDDFKLLDNNRPNINGALFSDHVVCSAGSAMGMARCYSTMQAQTSYTAFRGEMIMTWVTFRYWQKWLERYAQDWQAIRALRFAMKAGDVPPLPEGWGQALSWQHPRMPSVNPLLDQQTFLAALKNGTTSLEQEVGSGWQETIEELITEIEVLKKSGIPHAMFESKSGGEAPGATETKKSKTEEED